MVEEDYFTDKKRTKATKLSLISKLETYRGWLLQLTICDPACGSGAFLNQALDFLIREHKYVDELQAKLFGDAMVLSDMENSILENNLFGVDLNEESVEIAKLSLWLRTAQPNRKLNDLSSNIKCGNSLIHDAAVAGNKAFDWEKEFPQIFGKDKTATGVIVEKELEKPNYLKLIKEKSLEAQLKAKQGIELSTEALEITRQLAEYIDKLDSVSEPLSAYGIPKGGFDVIIGNPPYVRLETMKEISEEISKMNYKTFEKRGDLYCLFVERGFEILKKGGLISYIMPNKWMQAGYGKALREYLLEYELIQLIDFGDIQIFEGATTYPSIFVSRKSKPKKDVSVSVLSIANKDDFFTNVIQTTELFDSSKFSGDTWVISSGNAQRLLEQLNIRFKTLNEFVGGGAYYGIKTGLTEAFLIDEKTKKIIADDLNSSSLIKPFLQGRDVKAYATPNVNSHLILMDKGFTKRNSNAGNEAEAWSWFENKFPSAAQWLKPFEGKAKQRTDMGDYWWELRACDYYDKFSMPKILYQKFQVKPCFIYDEQGLYCNDSMWIIPTNNKGLLAILNSRMGWWLITKYCTQIQNGYQLIWKYFGQIPIANPSPELAIQAERMLTLSKALQDQSIKFQRSIQRKFEVEELPKKLQDWYLLSYAEFIKELAKKKVKLSLSEEAEWEDYFNQESRKALELKATIDDTDKAIDKMVYALYGLSAEEIDIVEQR